MEVGSAVAGRGQVRGGRKDLPAPDHSRPGVPSLALQPPLEPWLASTVGVRYSARFRCCSPLQLDQSV